MPEVAPASSRKGWSRPWSGRGGNGTVRIPTTLGPGTEGPPCRGVKPSPLPGMRGYGPEESPREGMASPAPGCGGGPVPQGTGHEACLTPGSMGGGEEVE